MENAAVQLASPGWGQWNLRKGEGCWGPKTFCRRKWESFFWVVVSKKYPTGPIERTPEPEYLIALAPYLGVHWEGPVWFLMDGFKYFFVQHYLGRWSNLTHIFQMGWNHQLVFMFENATGARFLFSYLINTKWALEILECKSSTYRGEIPQLPIYFRPFIGVK